MNTEKFKKFTEKFDNFEKGQSKSPYNKNAYDMHIMSSNNIMNMLSYGTGCLDATEKYVCYGVFRGGTLFPAAVDNPTKKCIGLDNWSKFDNEKKNSGIVQSYIKKHDIKNIKLFEQDYKPFFKEFKGKMGLLFADGDHTYEATKKALELAEPKMSKKSVIIIDDTDRAEVYNAVIDFLKDSEFKMIWDLKGAKHQKHAHMGLVWWSGIMVLIK